MRRTTIGVLTYRDNKRFMEPDYFRDLIREGRKLGADVYLFSHQDVQQERKKVYGFVPNAGGGWSRRELPWPDIVIDRFRSHWTPALTQLRESNCFRYANNHFTFKSEAMKLYTASEAVRKWVPETELCSPETLRRFLQRHRIVYVKPANGTGGFGVMKIARRGTGYLVQAREKKSALRLLEFGSLQALLVWTLAWTRSQSIRSGRFLVQMGLNTELVPGRVADVRVLIQKNGDGEWQLTGKALRIGGRNSPTTNLLRGRGGTAVPFDEFMRGRFGAEQAERIGRECDALAFAVVAAIEERFGPMMEFGLDVGVDKKGRVWLLEANPKPSRDVFLKTGETGIYVTALRRPIEYALYLARRAKSDGQAAVTAAKENADGMAATDGQRDGSEAGEMARVSAIGAEGDTEGGADGGAEGD
ncbi:MAG: YheC/YheD family protein [Paenibacillaceae bacterium]|nr:YheC/YheD family protein [Paenibacillaceae bacterium]